MWSRQTPQTTLLTTAAPLNAPATGPFGGSAVDAGIDQRLTLRRLLIQIAWGPSAGGVIDADLILRFGVVLAGIGQPLRNPALVAVADRQADWLYLHTFPLASALNTALTGLIGWDPAINIRAMRRVDEDQVIGIVMALDRGGGGALTAGQQLSVTTISSSLFSRTRR